MAQSGQQNIFLGTKRSALLVNGFIRHCFESDRDNIPVDIIELCLKWYFVERDYWDLNRVPETVTIDGDVAGITKRAQTYFYYTVVGSIIISKSTSIKEWKLKGLKVRRNLPRFYFVVGIIPTDADTTYEAVYRNGYGLDVYDGEIKVFGENTKRISINHVKQDDVLTIKFINNANKTNVDTCHGELYYGLNDMEFIKSV